MENNGTEQNDQTTPEENEFLNKNNNNNVKEMCKQDTSIKSNTDKLKKQPNESFIKTKWLLYVAVVALGIALNFVKVPNEQLKLCENSTSNARNKYWVYSAKPDAHTKTGLLKHVHLVLERLGYEKISNDTPWTLLWAYDSTAKLNLRNVSSNQKVNQMPGTGYITSKVSLVTETDSKYIPKAFRLPNEKDAFLKYAEKNKDAMFVEKSITHRKVYLKPVNEINLTNSQTFVQEYMQNPFLIDGHKFDIGIYVVITSVDPLRVYYYSGDMILRFCLEKYHPLDPLNLGKYVVGDKYLPTWEVPSLAPLHSGLGLSMKETFNTYVRSLGKDPAVVWEETLKAIREIFIKKEHLIVKAMKGYKSPESFFQLIRFDFILDEDLNVFLLEANMSPNLVSYTLVPNQLLYEQVLYNLFLVTGIANKESPTAKNREEFEATQNMVATQKNIAVFGDECSTICKVDCRTAELCLLCKTCLQPKMKQLLIAAHRESTHRGEYRRLIPPPMKPTKDLTSLTESTKNLTLNNRLLHLWYQGKCNQDTSWCT